MNEIRRLLLWINSEVDKLSGVGLAQMSEILSAAQRELQADLARWLAKHGGSERFTSQVYRNALAQIQGSLRTISKKSPIIAQVLKRSGSVASQTAVKHLIAEVEKFSRLFEGSIRPIPFEAAAVIARGDLLWPRFDTSAARYAGQIGDDIRKQLGIGVVRGESIDQLTARLARLGGPRGQVALQGKLGSPGVKAEYIAEGLFKRYRHWGERLARTETVNAYNTVAMDGIREAAEHDPGYVKRWDAALDARTCELCGLLDDEIAPVDGSFTGGIAQPPRHPNCRCAVVLWRESWSRPVTPVTLPHTIEAPDRLPKPEKAKKPRSRKPIIGQPVSPAQHLKAGTDLARVREEFLAQRKREKFDRSVLINGLAGLPDSGHAGLAGTQIRTHANRLFARYGLRFMDLRRPDRNDLYVVKKLGALGVHSWDGAIMLNADSIPYAKKLANEGLEAVLAEIRVLSESVNTRATTDALVKFASAQQKLQPIHTLVHEVMHGYSPQTPGVYQGVGVIIEEVTTEVASRKITRDLLGLADEAPWFSGPAKQGYMKGDVAGSYGNMITEVVNIIRKELPDRDPHAAYALIERASFAIKQDHRKIYEKPIDYANAFIDKLKLGDPDAEERILARLMAM